MVFDGAVPCLVFRCFLAFLLPLPWLTLTVLWAGYGCTLSTAMSVSTTAMSATRLTIVTNDRFVGAMLEFWTLYNIVFYIFLACHFLCSQLSKPVQVCLTNNNSTYRAVPCGTIKIPSESSICLPAMPAVSWPSWATSVPLLQCIIHEPPNSTEDSPGDSQAQQCRTALGET